jgi:hypothetical protein
MKGRVSQYLFAVILCVVAYSNLFPHLLDTAGNPQDLKAAGIFVKNEAREHRSRQIIVSAARSSNHSDLLPSRLVWEVEETDDEDGASDDCHPGENLSKHCSETAFIDLITRSNKVTPVPLFILLHSWRHFLPSEQALVF